MKAGVRAQSDQIAIIFNPVVLRENPVPTDFVGFLGFWAPVLTEFVGWYNHGRVHEGLNGIPDPDPAIDGPKPLGSRLVAIPVLNGLHHDYRLAA